MNQIFRREVLDMSRTFTSLEKRSKKEQREFYNSQRGSWGGLNPTTRIVPDKKKYSRTAARQNTRNLIRDGV
jgi:hypothetical protein